MGKITSFDQVTITLRAENLGISGGNAYVIMYSKGVPKIQIGKQIMVTNENFRAWMEKQAAFFIAKTSMFRLRDALAKPSQT